MTDTPLTASPASPSPCTVKLSVPDLAPTPAKLAVIDRAAASVVEFVNWMSDAAAAELTYDPAHKDFMRDLARRALSGVRAELLDPGAAIVAGITAVALPGHCPGQMGLEILSHGERLLFVADAIIDPIAVEFPDAIAVFDHVPAVAVTTRLALLERAASQNAIVATSHCPFPGLGRITRSAGGAWRWDPAT